MSTRVWRQILTDALHEAPRTPAQDAVLRLALSMLGADDRAALTPEQREWIRKRLERTTDGGRLLLTPEERARVQEPLLEYIEAYHPRIFTIVAKQFAQGGRD